MNVLTINELSKSFGIQKVIDNLNFSVPEGTVFGFIGQNGAGKTTTMKMILGLLKADSGEITICGQTVSYGQTKTNRSTCRYFSPFRNRLVSIKNGNYGVVP